MDADVNVCVASVLDESVAMGERASCWLCTVPAGGCTALLLKSAMLGGAALPGASQQAGGSGSCAECPGYLPAESG